MTKQQRMQLALERLVEGKDTINEICKKMNIPVGDLQHYINKLGKEKKVTDAAVRNEVYTQCKAVWQEYGEVALDVFHQIITEAE